MKKGLKIAGIVLAVVLVLMISIPFLFKGKIKDAVINTANKQLNAEVNVGDFGLNLFSNFPNATLSLNDFSISGIGDFKGDTLVQAKSVSATINLFTLFSGNYEVSGIILGRANVYAKLLVDERANWDIVKDTTTQADETPFSLSLKKIRLDNCNVVYIDQVSDMKVVLTDWSGNLSGDFTADETTIKTQSTISELSYFMAGIPYLSKIKTTADATLKADLKNMKFVFVDSQIQLNEMKGSIDGSLAMIGEDGIDFDLKLNASETQFKDILSIIPAMYTQDFESVKTSGTASLDASVKGLLEGEVYPAFNLKLQIHDAMFQYPSLPKPVNNINIDMLIQSKGGALDNMVIDINKFNFTMGGNPFSASLNIQTPMSDPNLKAHLNGTLDLSMIKEVYPLEKGVELNGRLVANMNIATKMSFIEKEQYENVTASGQLKLNNMRFKSQDMADVMINDAALDFTPKFVNLTSLNLMIGKNDISATGKLENFIAYVLKNQTLKGQLNLKSNYFNLNDFMGDETATTSNKENDDAIGVFIVPENIDFVLNATMNKVVYNKINLTNLVGTITVKDGIVTMKDVRANALGGSGKVNGIYNTADNPTKPKVNFSINLDKVSFSETFKTVESIQKFAPIFDKIVGSYSMNLNLNTTLGSSLLQVLGSLSANGLLQTGEVKVEGVESLNKLATSLNAKNLSSFSTKDINIPFSIQDGKILTKPFNVKIGDTKLSLDGGTTGLDESVNYKGTITLPKSLANNYLNNVGFVIGGTFTNPKISIDTKAMLGSVAEGLLGGSVADKKEELGNKLNDEKIKQAQKLREEAQKTSDKLVEEAKLQGQKLVDASKNPIAKIAAQKASDKLVEEAKKQGSKIVEEAGIQAKKIETVEQ